MSNPVEGTVHFVKQHPLLSGAAVLAIVAAVFILPGMGGGTTSNAVVGSSGPSADTIAANTQITMGQQAANVQTANIGAQRDVALAQTAGAVQTATIGAQVQAESNRLAAGVAFAQINSQTVTSLASTEANRQVQLGAQDAAIMQTQLVTQGASNVAQINANAQTSVANAQASAVKKKSNNDLLGGIVKGVFSLFSDRRLKQIIAIDRIDANGVRWYRYRYNPIAQRALNLDGDLYIGVIAQELLNTRFRNCVSMINGFYVVNYSELQQMERAVA